MGYVSDSKGEVGYLRYCRGVEGNQTFCVFSGISFFLPCTLIHSMVHLEGPHFIHAVHQQKQQTTAT